MVSIAKWQIRLNLTLVSPSQSNHITVWKPARHGNVWNEQPSKSFTRVNTLQNVVSQVCTHFGRVLLRLKCALTRQRRAKWQHRPHQSWEKRIRRQRISGRHRVQLWSGPKSWKLTQRRWPKLHAGFSSGKTFIKKCFRHCPDHPPVFYCSVQNLVPIIWDLGRWYHDWVVALGVE